MADEAVTREVILSDLIRMLASYTKRSDLTAVDESSAVFDLGLDSLSLFNFLLELEKSCSKRFPDEYFVASRIRTIADIIDLQAEAGFIPQHVPQN